MHVVTTTSALFNISTRNGEGGGGESGDGGIGRVARIGMEGSVGGVGWDRWEVVLCIVGYLMVGWPDDWLVGWLIGCTYRRPSPRSRLAPIERP